MFISNAVVYFQRRKPIYNLQCALFVDMGSVSSRNPFVLTHQLENKNTKVTKTGQLIYNAQGITFLIMKSKSILKICLGTLTCL